MTSGWGRAGPGGEWGVCVLHVTDRLTVQSIAQFGVGVIFKF